MNITVKKYGGPEVLEIGEIKLNPPGEGEVLVEIHFAGVNPVDTYLREGKNGYEPPLPFTPGVEGAGIVKICGSGVESVEPGDKVFIGWSHSGCYAQTCLAAEAQLYKLPPGLSLEEGAALFVNYFTAWRALVTRGEMKSSDKVLIHGASGGVGIASLQWCRHYGNSVWGTAGSVEGLDLIESQKAVGWADHSHEGYLEELVESAGGFDLIIEMLAHVNLEEDLKLLNPGGRVIVVGSRGLIEINPRLTMGKETDIRGLTLGSASLLDLEECYDVLNQACVRDVIHPVIQSVYPLEKAGEAHRELFASPSKGKILLDCRL